MRAMNRMNTLPIILFNGTVVNFTGEQIDGRTDHASNLYYLRARYYDPRAGRFTVATQLRRPLPRRPDLTRHTQPVPLNNGSCNLSIRLFHG